MYFFFKYYENRKRQQYSRCKSPPVAPQVELAHWGITESWQSFGAWESGKNPRISDTACLVKTQQKRRDTSSANFLGGGYVWVEIEIVVIMRLRLPRFILWFPSFSQLSTSQNLVTKAPGTFSGRTVRRERRDWGPLSNAMADPMLCLCTWT